VHVKLDGKEGSSVLQQYGIKHSGEEYLILKIVPE